MKLQSINRYEAYKDSGVEWLGDVPAHWKISRIKEKGSVKARVGWKALKASEYVDDGFAFLSTPNIKNKDIDFKNVNYITYERYAESPEIMLKEDDILLAKDGSTLGIVNIVNFLPRETTVNSSIAVLRFEQTIFNKYIFYQIESKYIQDKIQLKKGGMGVPHLFQQDINNFIILIPPLSEQTAIAAYLDTKTAQIDRQIDLLSQKAAQYGKLKQSLINETVTRGLDKTVAMKNSGVEWVGEIPAHWILNRHKDNFSFVTDRCTNSSLAKVGLENIEGKTGRFISTDTDFDGDGVEFKKNDILFGKLRPYLAKVYLAEFNGNAVGDIFVYRPKRNTKPRFALYLMLSDKYIDVINSSTAGAKMPRVSSNFIANLPVSMPSRQEQQAIAAYLDEKTANIDRIVATFNTQIDKLKELRKTLINDVVTGKIKVA